MRRFYGGPISRPAARRSRKEPTIVSSAVDRDRHEGSSRIPGRRRRADLLVFDGSVLMMDAEFSRADAVAIADGTVVAAGRIDDVRRLVDRRPELLDAGGAPSSRASTTRTST
jgi:hypothetical protein